MKINIEEIQEYNRKAIIMACNPSAKSYRDALRLDTQEGAYWECASPRTLDRVLRTLKLKSRLRAIKINDGLDDEMIYIQDYRWNLTKTTLENQEVETQQAIYKLLGGK